jgi:hypothetical protein
MKRERITANEKELKIYDKAIAEIESTFGHIIYSPDFYVNQQTN